MAEPSPYQSLYRRYRSQRFDEVLGQDHVSRALRNAVRDGRVGHAYLFSGPRGTGKTSTARILAKVLNCAAPRDGEPCGQCESCQIVERGQDIDWLLEQDAASKSKVDDMRDLLDRVPLGTSGNRKVIILDEVHMLSQGAENALLKTLEEPPDHVIFVLATTDPQKVRPTIRSRTQHFEFHLLPADVLDAHVRSVIAGADLSLPDDAVDEIVEHVVRAGGGSARDTLSALDQVAALGEVVVDTQPVDAILDALAARDAGAILVAVAEAVATGREPRVLGENLIVRLRDAFLAVMGAGDDHLPPAEHQRARALGEKLGAAGLTRALDVLGEALTELARKPDPRVVIEVALVRLARPDTDRSVDSLVARVDALEQQVREGVTGTAPGTAAGAPAQAPPPAGSPPAAAGGGEPAGTATAPAPTPGSGTGGEEPTRPPASGGAGPASAARAALARERESRDDPEEDPAGTTGSGKQTLGALSRGRDDTGADAAEGAADAAPSPSPDPDPAPAAAAPEAATDAPAQAPAPPPADAAGRPAAPPAASSDVPDLERLVAAWSESVLGELPIPVRSKWRGGRWQDVAGGAARFVVPNEWHKKACDEGRNDVEQALDRHFGVQVPVEVVVDGGGEGTGPGPGPGSAAAAPGSGGTPAGRAPSSPAEGAGPPPAEPPGGPDGPDDLDVDDLADLSDARDVTTGGVQLLVREFGGELMTTDDVELR